MSVLLPVTEFVASSQKCLVWVRYDQLEAIFVSYTLDTLNVLIAREITNVDKHRREYMYFNTMLPKVIVKSRLAMATGMALPVAMFGIPLKMTCEAGSEHKNEMKISELPIYGNPKPVQVKLLPEEVGSLDTAIRSARQQVWIHVDYFKGLKNDAMEKIEIGKAHTQSTIQQIEDSSLVPKLAILTVSGLGGILLGYRGGALRKTAFGTMSLIAATSVCFPVQTTTFIKENYNRIMDSLPESMKSKTADGEKKP